MRKLIYIVMVMLGITSQAQTFNFSCAEEVTNTITVDFNFNLGNDVVGTDVSTVLNVSSLEDDYSFILDVPYGYLAVDGNFSDTDQTVDMSFTSYQNSSTIEVNISLNNHDFSDHLTVRAESIKSYVFKVDPKVLDTPIGGAGNLGLFVPFTDMSELPVFSSSPQEVEWGIRLKPLTSAGNSSYNGIDWASHEPDFRIGTDLIFIKNFVFGGYGKPNTSSTDITYSSNRVVGGELDGYVRIVNWKSIDVFAYWESGNVNAKIAFVTHTVAVGTSDDDDYQAVTNWNADVSFAPIPKAIKLYGDVITNGPVGN